MCNRQVNWCNISSNAGVRVVQDSCDEEGADWKEELSI